MEKKEEKIKELIRKYNIDIDSLEQEQKKIAKTLDIRDSVDFKLADRIAAVENSFFKNKIVSAVMVFNSDMELIEQNYSSEILKFPYLPGFRAYRELPAMIDAFQKIEESPDFVFIHGHGILHPRLGLASHFSVSTSVPSIGIADSILEGEIKGDYVFIKGKKAGKILQSKKGSKPLYISPGNLISIKTAYELAEKLIQPPHKLPEPLHITHKYAKKTRDELLRV
jgi:deoxyribonuclease V